MTHHLRVFIFTVCMVGACGRGTEQSSPQSAKLPAIDPQAAAEAFESVEFGPPEAHPELAIRALATLERARLGEGFSTGLEALVVSSDHRDEAAAPTISAHLKLLDTACAIGGRELMHRLAELEGAQRSATIWSECDFKRHGLLESDEISRTDPTVLLLLHMAYSRLEAAGNVDTNERKLFELAVDFGRLGENSDLP